ncbi:hypothetical protein D3C79_214880 [compost metagenome]
MPSAAIGSRSDRPSTSSLMALNCAGVSKLTTFFTSAMALSKPMAAFTPMTNGAAMAPPCRASPKVILPRPELFNCLRSIAAFLRTPLSTGDSLSTPVIRAFSWNLSATATPSQRVDAPRVFLALEQRVEGPAQHLARGGFPPPSEVIGQLG